MAVSAVLRVIARSKVTALWVGFGENGWFAVSNTHIIAANFSGKVVLLIVSVNKN